MALLWHKVYCYSRVCGPLLKAGALLGESASLRGQGRPHSSSHLHLSSTLLKSLAMWCILEECF